MKIFQANPKAEYLELKSEIEKALLSVSRRGNYILGEEVKFLEREFATYIGSNYAIGVASGTDAIEISLRALGIGIGDEVITVSHTAVATVAAIEACGATPILIDIEEDFYTLCPKQLEEVYSSRTKAIIAVHIYGQGCDLHKILRFCKDKNIELIEDVSQAHGGKYKERYLGNFGKIACFSCYPTKNLGALGDAGLITTNDHELSTKCKMIREYGWDSSRISKTKGICSRLDELQAAVLRVKLKYLEKNNLRRKKISQRYYKNLLDSSFILPKTRKNYDHVFHLYVVRSKHRDKIISNLIRSNIFLNIHYPVPIHLQPAYKSRILTATNLINTEKICSEIFSLPIFPQLSISSVDEICNLLTDYN